MATISSVLICNMALSHVGTQSSIENLTEETPEAKACNMWFNHARQCALEDFNWNFARVRKALALSDEDAPDDWLFRYSYPTDCVKARLIFNAAGQDADPVPFEIESLSDGSGLSILTDVEDAILIYTRNVTNPALFTPSFATALSWRVAMHIAFTLTGDDKRIDSAEKGYVQSVQYAAMNNAGESMGRAPRDSEFIRSRV